MKNLFIAAALMSALSVNAQTAKISVAVDQPGHKISPTLWGIFFEDINLSADGGLYPELVRNRSFEDADTPEYWKLTNTGSGQSTASIESHHPLNTFNLHNLRVNANGAFTLANEGYWGMNIVQGDSYQFRLAVRAENNFNSPLTVKILSSTGTVLASGEVFGFSDNWRYHSLRLTASASDPKATLEISSSGKGSLFLDMVSLLPEKTWKGHGLRTDLAESLDALHPAFLRFPGGNWVEGDDLPHMYHWKYTIGDIDARTPLWNTWGYNTTHGLGFHEYLQLCEDLGAEPLFDISVGMSLHDSVPVSRMGQWIQDALDAIEYANGPTNSIWGSLRAKAGHPAPFHLKFMEIGNENGGPDYVERWPLLVNAIRAKYPEMQLIMTTDLRGRPYPKNPQPDIIDEHYYESPESFMRRANQYDSYDRNGPKIFIGEYAVTEKCGLGNLRAAIGEAAFMTGMERNSDVVTLASYAPLFVNMNHRAWNPDLINFDSSRWYGLPGYYVQQMFSQNRGDVTLPIQVDSPKAEAPVSKGMIGVGTWNTASEYKDIKVTAPDGTVLLASDFSKNSDGWKKLGDGVWSIKDGALQQSAEKPFVRALAGDAAWTDYTLTLKARKLNGQEGFLILFHIMSDDDRIWWNIGGWNNTQDAIQNGATIDSKPEQIEAGRWYDVKVVVTGRRVKCYLDGKLMHDVNYESDGQVNALYACAAHDDQTGDVIVKVVNASANPLTTQLDLSGAKNLTGHGRATVLTSEKPTDENTLETPRKVSPKTETVDFTGTTLTRAFPGNSFTVLRFSTAK
ncbi:MAG TPA: alpha-L-arabinofuranosidase C-terminal domain-containing protein [Verrucomicrobiae bacterium]|jgi:alpha-L-arabinofuranosidase